MQWIQRVRISKAQDPPRHRLAHGVAQAKIRAHSLGMQGKGNEEGWEYLQMWFEEVLKHGRTKPLGIFVKAILVAHKYEAPVQAELLPSMRSSSFHLK